MGGGAGGHPGTAASISCPPCCSGGGKQVEPGFSSSAGPCGAGWGGGRKGEIGGIEKSETQIEKDGNWETQRNKERNSWKEAQKERRDREREGNTQRARDG